MADIWDSQKRSEVMSRIKGHGNQSTELRLISLMKEAGIKGWRRKQKLPGKPDFVFRKERVCVFVDGCFWHGCPRCYRRPGSNQEFWGEKVRRNKARDRRVNWELRNKGWQVLRIRECQLRKAPKNQLKRLSRKLAETDT